MQTNRKEFLHLLTAAALLRPVAQSSPQQAATAAETKEQFSAQVLEDCGAAARCALCYIGDQLGLFKAMASSGPVTAAELARKTELNARMLREWLNAMATARYVEYRPADKTYLLTKEHAQILADEESSPLFIGGMFQLLSPTVSATPKVANAFQTGKPVTMYDFTADLYLGMERASPPNLKHQLVQNWTPLLPRVQEALISGGTAVDVGCGTGLASIVLAKAFPKSQFAGYDPFAPSIRRARELAKKEGIADRVQFVAADSSKLPPARFDLVTIFNSVHHFSDPVTTLRHCRQALKAGGTCFVVDGNLSLNPEENMNLTGRVAYPITTLYCLQDSMANQGAGLGAEFNEAVLRDLAGASPRVT
jgi:ubiquinone/menaquinone biosynthesis C-methylase UbiE